MLVVHHLGISQSDRIVWLCEELEIPYELKLYARDSQTRLAPADYRALTPFGTAPVITDGDLVLGESAAIVEYVCTRHGGGRLLATTEATNYPDFLFWFHFANGSLMPTVMMDMIAGQADESGEKASATVTARLDRAYDQIEARLADAPYLAGDAFTAADLLTIFPLTTGRLFAPRDISGYPNIRAYLRRIGDRPAFQRAMAKADPGFTVPLD